MPNSHWHSRVKVDPEKYNGFIYVIINKKTKMYYVGKKQYATKTRPWRSYKSSSRILKEEMKDCIEDFKFIIIEQYKTSAGLSWAEIYTQVFLETPNDRNSF